MRLITTHTAPATGLRSITDTSWHTQAVCHCLDPYEAEIFFPMPRDHAAIAEAKALCALCPVQRECLNYALENDLHEGIWGGLTEAERRPWHDGLPQRLDYQRILAVFHGRNVHLTAKERDIVIDHAYLRGWRADRLALVLRTSQQHARDLLTEAGHKVFDRDRTLGVPPEVWKKPSRRKPRPPKQATRRPTTDRPFQRQPTASQPAMPASGRGPFGKAA